MASPQKPRRHHHLSRESIARAALRLVDEEGSEALTLRRLAARLGVGATNLYTYHADRDAIVSDVVALLLSEVDLEMQRGTTWEECVLQVGHSLRAMALRHPRAFTFVAGTSYGDWPLEEHGRRVDALLLERGVPAESLPTLASLLDSYATGFLSLETQELARTTAQAPAFVGGSGSSALNAPDFDNAFREGLATIVAGIRARRLAPASGGGADSSGV